MDLCDKLNVALCYDKYDPISFFTYSWNSIGVPLEEEKIRLILEGIPICELTTQEKYYITKMLPLIQKRFSEQDLETGNIDIEEIRILLANAIPNLQKYPERLDELATEIIKVLPEASFIKDPEGSEVGKIKGLRSIPKIKKEPVDLAKLDPIKPFKFKSEISKRPIRQEIPSGILKRTTPPEHRPSYKIRRRFRKLTPSEKMKRAREILKRKRK